MFKFLVIIGLTAIANARQIADYRGRIINGYDINIEEIPYQVGIFAGEYFSCGGSIISVNYVLTAAHCYLKNHNLIVHAGSSDIKEGGSFHKVIEAIVHENYSKSTVENDIALFKVHPNFLLDDTRYPIRLREEGTVLEVGDMALISGWGTTEEGGEVSQTLQAVNIPIISHELCQKKYRFVAPIFPESQICAAHLEGGKDSCQGDSGGPLVVKKFLVGVVSWGNGCARAAFPGVYSDVAYYRPWIRHHTGF